MIQTTQPFDYSIFNQPTVYGSTGQSPATIGMLNQPMTQDQLMNNYLANLQMTPEQLQQQAKEQFLTGKGDTTKKPDDNSNTSSLAGKGMVSKIMAFY